MTMRTIFLLTFVLMASCQNPSGNPALASAPYPVNLHNATSVSIQVIRDNEFIEIVNSTAKDYRNTVLWINQRYSSSLPTVLAGSTLRFNLWALRDPYGEQFNAGGLWRTDEPTTLVIAELQLDQETPLVGLVVIGEE
jgi:hypothetical protein